MAHEVQCLSKSFHKTLSAQQSETTHGRPSAWVAGSEDMLVHVRILHGKRARVCSYIIAAGPPSLCVYQSQVSLCSLWHHLVTVKRKAMLAG